MSLGDVIYAETGIAFDPPCLAGNHDARSLIATLIAIITKSDYGFSADETARMVEMLRSRFQLEPNEVLTLIPRASDELATCALRRRDADGAPHHREG